MRPSHGSNADLLNAHRDAIRELLAARGIADVRVFGSVARGDDDDQSSDIDLLVELDGDRSPGAELLEALELTELLTGLVTKQFVPPPSKRNWMTRLEYLVRGQPPPLAARLFRKSLLAPLFLRTDQSYVRADDNYSEREIAC